MTDEIEHAFPRVLHFDDGSIQESVGMTLRDYFAAKAMAMKFGPTDNTSELRVHAANCYEMADAMMEARKS